jgi:rhodanese-related sulfurtransferase
MDGDRVVYVGKGRGKRFAVQQRRFKHCTGEIFASMLSEEAALAEERRLIELHKPEFNLAYTTHVAEPWKLTLLPQNDKDFYYWCDAIGTRAMAARILLKKGINVKQMISRIGPIPLEVKFV